MAKLFFSWPDFFPFHEDFFVLATCLPQQDIGEAINKLSKTRVERSDFRLQTGEAKRGKTTPDKIMTRKSWSTFLRL